MRRMCKVVTCDITCMSRRFSVSLLFCLTACMSNRLSVYLSVSLIACSLSIRVGFACMYVGSHAFISVHPRSYICEHVSLSDCLFSCLHVCHFVYLSNIQPACYDIHMNVNMFYSLSVCLLVLMSARLSICLFICFVCLSAVSLPVSLSGWLTDCLYLYLSDFLLVSQLCLSAFLSVCM